MNTTEGRRIGAHFQEQGPVRDEIGSFSPQGSLTSRGPGNEPLRRRR